MQNVSWTNLHGPIFSEVCSRLQNIPLYPVYIHTYIFVVQVILTTEDRHEA